MPDTDVPAEALALVARIAGAIRAELGAEIDAYPGASSPERADPINRAFRAVARTILSPDASGVGDPHSLVSHALRRVAEHRLAAEGWGEHQVKTLIDEEPGSPDDWLCFLILSSRAQIEPLLGRGGPDLA